MIPSPLQFAQGERSRWGATSKEPDFSTIVASQNSIRLSPVSFCHHSSRVGGFGISIFGAGPLCFPLFVGGGALRPWGGLILGGSMRKEPAPYFAKCQSLARFGRASKKPFVSSSVTAGSLAWNV